MVGALSRDLHMVGRVIESPTYGKYKELEKPKTYPANRHFPVILTAMISQDVAYRIVTARPGLSYC